MVMADPEVVSNHDGQICQHHYPPCHHPRIPLESESRNRSQMQAGCFVGGKKTGGHLGTRGEEETCVSVDYH